MRLTNRERVEDAKTFSLRECLAFVQRAYDMTGQPDLRDVIDRANAALQGRVSRDDAKDQQQALTA